MATRRKRLASKKKRGTEITVDQAYRIAPTTGRERWEGYLQVHFDACCIRMVCKKQEGKR